MIQKNNKTTCIYFYLFWAGGGGGGKINRPGILPPGGEDKKGGGQDILGQLAPWGASQVRLACPPGGKLSRGQDKLDTGIQFYGLLSPYLCLISFLCLNFNVLGLDAWII